MNGIVVTAKNKEYEPQNNNILDTESLRIFNHLQKICKGKALHYIDHRDSPLIAYKITKNFTLVLKANKKSATFYLNDLQNFGKITNLEIFESSQTKSYENEKIHSAIKRIEGLTDINKVKKFSNVTFKQYRQLINYLNLDVLDESEIDNLDYINKKCSPELLFEKLENQSQIGAEGELFAVNWEKNRLINEENATEEEAEAAVKHVALQNTSLGYDIISKYKEEIRFIEVKTTNSYKKKDFFFTINEFKVLKKLKEKAYIYRVTLDTEKVEVIINPFDSKKTSAFTAVVFKTNLDCLN